MKVRTYCTGALVVAVLIALSSVGSAERSSRFVLSASNGANRNTVRLFQRQRDGRLVPKRAVGTGGRGTGSFLSNQNGLIVDGSDVLVVNARSNQLSLLRLVRGALRFVSIVAVDGVQPVSVTRSGELVYVVSEGDGASPASVSGYRLKGDVLAPIEGAKIALSTSNPGPAQIAFTPDGNALVITERTTNQISIISIDRASGLFKQRSSFESSGQTPWGFEFTSKGILLVSEAFQGGDSAVSSYRVPDSSMLSVISASVDAGAETDACWITATSDGTVAFVTNTNVGSISSYSVAADGSLALLRSRAGRKGGLPVDLDLSPDDRFLYTLNIGSNRIEVYVVAPKTGALKFLQEVPVPGGSNGIWVR